jgi:hypothetical protein
MDMDRYNLYWGETHDNTHQAPDPDFSMERNLERAASHLDFYCSAYYPSCSPAFRKGGHPSEDKGKQPLNVEGWKPEEQIKREWGEVKAALQEINRKGSLVVFPGYEWQGDGTWGDHNIYYCEDDPPLYRVDTLKELYQKLQGHRALVIPHHTAYIQGFRGKNWEVHDEALSPFMEIFSIHGSSEGEAFGGTLRNNPFLGPEAGGGSYSKAILEGKKLGVIASTDNWGVLPGHYGRGLAAAWAEDLSRDSLWDAFTSRRIYGVSGDRILLWFELDGAPMGSILSGRRKAPVFRVFVDALDRIDYIDFIRDEELIDRVTVFGNDPSAPGPFGPPETSGEFLLRIEYGWGPAENVLSLPPKKWNGMIRIKNGEISSASPCWISPDQEFSLNKREFSFRGEVSQETASQQVHNGYVLKVKGNMESLVEIDIDGAGQEVLLEEMCRESSVLWNRKSSEELIRNHFSVEPGVLNRKDVLFGMAYKVKVHQVKPASVCRRDVSFTDHLYDGIPHVYRIRVRQRNGQLAWSSPIWLE